MENLYWIAFLFIDDQNWEIYPLAKVKSNKYN